MNMTKDCKIEAACSTDETRPRITNPYITKFKDGRHYMCASDGRLAVIVPVDMEDNDTLGPVPIDALKAARKAAPHHKMAMTVNGDVKLEDGRAFPRPEVDKIPPMEVYFEEDPKREVVFTTTLDPKQLKRIADAMGCTHLRLEFSVEKRKKNDPGPVMTLPIRIRPTKVEDTWVKTKMEEVQARAVLMPFREG